MTVGIHIVLLRCRLYYKKEVRTHKTIFFSAFFARNLMIVTNFYAMDIKLNKNKNYHVAPVEKWLVQSISL